MQYEIGDWTDELIKPFFNIKEEIAVDNKNGVVLRGTRIIIPRTLQTRIVKLAHTGHQGLAKTKALLRQHAWFPNMDKSRNRDMFTVPSQWTPELSRTVAITRNAMWTVANHPR